MVQHEDEESAPIGHECVVQKVISLPKQRSAESLTEMQGLYEAFLRENRGTVTEVGAELRVSTKNATRGS